jgi:hypothetical protein
MELVPALPVTDAVLRIFPVHAGLLDTEARALVNHVLAAVSEGDGGRGAGDGRSGWVLVAAAAGRAAGYRTQGAGGALEIDHDGVGESALSLATRGGGGMGGHDGAEPEPALVAMRFADTGLPGGGPGLELSCVGGQVPPRMPPPTLHPLLQHLLVQMLHSHASGSDLCLVGGRGEGKSFVARLFAAALGYAPAETLFLFEDMTARDLLQRRTTTSAGDTAWLPTPLTTAVATGRLCILDGLDRLSGGTLSVLLQLTQERELTMFDGSRFVSADRYARMRRQLGLTPEEVPYQPTHSTTINNWA